jgi:hypothetical protein
VDYLWEQVWCPKASSTTTKRNEEDDRLCEGVLTLIPNTINLRSEIRPGQLQDLFFNFAPCNSKIRFVC